MDRENNPIEALRKLVAAAECIRHWHDAMKDGSGMVVSAEHVRALWDETERARSALAAAEAAGWVMVRGIRLYTEPSSEAGQFVIVEASGVEVIRAFGALPDIMIDHYVTPVGISAAMIEAATLSPEKDQTP